MNWKELIVHALEHRYENKEWAIRLAVLAFLTLILVCVGMDLHDIGDL